MFISVHVYLFKQFTTKSYSVINCVKVLGQICHNIEAKIFGLQGVLNVSTTHIVAKLVCVPKKKWSRKKVSEEH